MVYSKSNPALLIMGIMMITIWGTAETGLLAAYIEHLGGNKYQYLGELTTLPLYFGVIAILAGLWQLIKTHKNGSLDYFLSAIAGTMFILIIAMLVRWFLAPEIEVASKGYGEVGNTGMHIHTLLSLNYVVLGILTGIIIVNVFKVPAWAENGVRLSPLGLKTGVILLGALYSVEELKNLGSLSIIMIGFFVLGSIAIILWLAKRKRISNSLGGVLSAGVGVCGVAATVAAAPVVQAKSIEISYIIGTILLWGVGCMFLFPVIGHLLGLTHIQFGAWAGTGILNPAQVTGAALTYQSDGIETLKVAEVFNITRVLILPIIIISLALWYVRHEENATEVKVGRIIFNTFPVFVLGFITLFALSSYGFFSPTSHYKEKYFDNNIPDKKLLTKAEIRTLRRNSKTVKNTAHKPALQRLIRNKKIMSIKDDATIRDLTNSKVMNKKSSDILKKAHQAVRHTSPKIEAFREWIIWLFAVGLVGMGMKITVSSIWQAGGQPALIGSIIGFFKAALSLSIVLLLISETI